jgi:hypothetical protein
MRAADDFDRVFTAMGNQRPDGLYVVGAGQLLVTNHKSGQLPARSHLRGQNPEGRQAR